MIINITAIRNKFFDFLKKEAIDLYEGYIYIY